MYIGECQHNHHRVAAAVNLPVNYEARLNKSGALAVAVGFTLTDGPHKSQARRGGAEWRAHVITGVQRPLSRKVIHLAS